MDQIFEGIGLVITTTVILVAFLLALLAVMLIYRKRKLQHLHELDSLNEKFKEELFTTQLEAQKRTMQHIGREIHDNVGHQLTLAFLYTQQADAKGSDTTGEVANIINNALKDLRSLSSDLIKNKVVASASLYQLLQEECEKLRSAGFCKVLFTPEPVRAELPQEVNTFALRIFQEFTQNSLKHSGCSQINVELEQVNDRLVLAASDNGKGFVIKNSTHKGIGLINMEKRAEIIRANFSLKSTPNVGTNMKLVIPVDQETSIAYETPNRNRR